jgi:hypothetical protein
MCTENGVFSNPTFIESFDFGLIWAYFPLCLRKKIPDSDKTANNANLLIRDSPLFSQVTAFSISSLNFIQQNSRLGLEDSNKQVLYASTTPSILSILKDLQDVEQNICRQKKAVRTEI